MSGDVEMLGALISQGTHFHWHWHCHWAQSKMYFGRMLGVLGEFQFLVIREDLLVSGTPNINVCSSSLLWNFLIFLGDLGVFSFVYQRGQHFFRSTVFSAVFVNCISDDVR